MTLDLDDLAALSHVLERLALALAEERMAVAPAAQELLTAAAGQREALAVALSYLLRRRSLATGDGATTESAIDAVVRALRRGA
ncbi:MAG TPA: hypothetical protein VFV35_02265 [Acidimicrobiales bacterium]|nr:hypothetical protein [Acidimicrobiales bacterium]